MSTHRFLISYVLCLLLLSVAALVTGLIAHQAYTPGGAFASLPAYLVTPELLVINGLCLVVVGFSETFPAVTGRNIRNHLSARLLVFFAFITPINIAVVILDSLMIANGWMGPLVLFDGLSERENMGNLLVMAVFAVILSGPIIRFAYRRYPAQ